MPQALRRLKALLERGLAATAAWWPDVRVGSRGVEQAAPILGNEEQRERTAVKHRLGGLLGAMPRHQATAGTRAPALAPFRTVTQSDWPGLLHGESVPELPRTHHEREQWFGAHRSHERRATGRQGASPALGLRGAVRRLAGAATRFHSVTSAARIPETVSAWQALRQDLETHRQQRTQRRRFRRDPAAYLAKLEADVFQLSLPP